MQRIVIIFLYQNYGTNLWLNEQTKNNWWWFLTSPERIKLILQDSSSSTASVCNVDRLHDDNGSSSDAISPFIFDVNNNVDVPMLALLRQIDDKSDEDNESVKAPTNVITKAISRTLDDNVADTDTMCLSKLLASPFYIIYRRKIKHIVLYCTKLHHYNPILMWFPSTHTLPLVMHVFLTHQI